MLDSQHRRDKPNTAPMRAMMAHMTGATNMSELPTYRYSSQKVEMATKVPSNAVYPKNSKKNL